MSESDALPPLPPPAPEGRIYAYPRGGVGPLPVLRPATPGRPWMTATGGRHAYRCLPLVQGCTQGWELLSPVDFSVTWLASGRGRAHENTDRLLIEVDGQTGRASGDFVKSFHGYGVVSIFSGYSFRTPAGVSLLLRGPANRPKRGIHALEAVVEADWYAGGELAFSWQVTNPGETIRFARGEPVGMIVPVPRGYAAQFTPELVDAPAEFERHEEAWSAARREEHDGPYSGNANLHPRRASYRLGLGLDGQRVADRRQRGPRPFVDRRTAPPPAPPPATSSPVEPPARPRRLLTAEQADLLDRIAGAQATERSVAADLGPRIRTAERAVLRGTTAAERLRARDEAARLSAQLHGAQHAARASVSRDLAALRRTFKGELVVPPGHGLRVIPEGDLRFVEVVELAP